MSSKDLQSLLNTASMDELVANLHARDHLGWGLLHYGVFHGKTEVVSKLLSVKSGMDATSNKGVTPLQIAAACNRPDAVSVLVNAKAALDLADHNKHTPLHRAAEKRNHLVTRQLLLAKADIESKSCRGWTPLCMAVRYDDKSENAVTTVALLLQAKARCDQVTNNKHSLLHLAQYASCAVVDMLLEAPSCKALLDACDVHACTPLMSAASKNNTYLVGALLAAKACLKKRDHQNMSAFDVAASQNHLQSAQLLARAAVPHDHELCTTTVSAVDSNHPCCLALLLHAKANPDESLEGTTLLGRAFLNEPSEQDLAANTQVLLYLLGSKATPFRHNMQPNEQVALYTVATRALKEPGEETATYLRKVLQELANTTP